MKKKPRRTLFIIQRKIEDLDYILRKQFITPLNEEQLSASIDSINQFEKFFEAEETTDFIMAMEFAKDRIFKKEYFTAEIIVSSCFCCLLLCRSLMWNFAEI